jgi:glycosyltransferase involved in cell wall biosynthesis
MTLRLAVNAVPLLSPRTGIQRYLYNLMEHVEVHDDIVPNYFYGRGWDRALLQTQASWVQGIPVQHVQRVKGAIRRFVPKAHIAGRILRQLAFSRKKRGQFDVYHEPDFVPYHFDGPTVITVHDLSFIRFPDSHPPERVNFMSKNLPHSLARAQVILTDSQFVKREIVEVYGVSPDKIEVAYLGASGDFRPMSGAETQRCCARHGLRHGQYFLAVGTIEPRKNLIQVLRAYQDLPQRVQEQYPLVVVGLKGWKYTSIEKEMAPLARNGRVRLLGYLSDEELPQIYAGATALLYTSHYEGFGLPPLEGMASGVPVITSNRSSIPEVVGNATIMVDPHDVEALKEGLMLVIEDAGKAQRLRELGIERAKGFTWERCARDTVAAYQRAAHG